MNYKKLLEQVANEHNTTPKEVESEIKKAINVAGYNIEPAMFISLIVSKVKNNIQK